MTGVLVNVSQCDKSEQQLLTDVKTFAGSSVTTHIILTMTYVLKYN